jgi:hypothetical protein
MRYFMIVMGVIIALTFVLAILAGPAQATAGIGVSARDAQPVDATPLIYVALVGGAALLAGFVWLGTLRRTPEHTPNSCETE